MFSKLILGLIAFVLLFTGVHAQSRRDPAALFLTADGHLTPPLIELLKLDGLYEPTDSLKDVVSKTQAHWIAVRQGRHQIERSDLVDTPQQAAQTEQVLAYAKALGLLDEISPSLKHYDYGICLGAFLDGVRMRLAALVKAWQRGIRFDTPVFLTGERYLRLGPHQEDSLDKLCDPTQSPLPFKQGWTFPAGAIYNTEYDMVRLVWDQVQIPADMAQALASKIVFVNAERGSQRPSTKDTYSVWLRDYQPQPGTLLAPSHPLVWIHQQLAGMSVLGPAFWLDTTAPPVSPKIQNRKAIVSLVHDTIAKCLFELDAAFFQRRGAEKTQRRTQRVVDG